MDSDEDVVFDDFNSVGESDEEVFEVAENCPDKYQYEVLSTEDIVGHMESTIKEVMTVVAMPATIIRILLNHFQWDKEKLMEKYYDGDQEKLFEEAHIVNPFNKDSLVRGSNSSENLTTKNNESNEECQICYMIQPTSDMTGLECGHRFCKYCWTEYLTSKIMEEGIGDTIACAAQSCDILVDDATVMQLVTDPKVKLKYQLLITNSFVQCNRRLKWCSTPDCNHAIKVQYVAPKPVTCKCNNTFCFQCGEDWHDPLLCPLLKKWLKKCVDDLETGNWLTANTKDCPKCNVPIEKNGGCNHMLCKNKACGTAFCWMCLKVWSEHTNGNGYNCNVFDKQNERLIEDAKTALQRYLFYSNRYVNHLQSLKFENKLYGTVKEKMEELQKKYSMSWIEVQFLNHAVDVLCSCRQVLMYTYAFAFYLKKNNQSTIFEDNQKDLENSIECLSGYLERELTGDDDLVDLKQKVQDKYRYCESRRKVLLDHVHEGYEKDMWEYLD